MRDYREAALCSLRYQLTRDADAFSEVDHSRSYDLIEELSERYATACARFASGKRGDRSNFEGDRSNFEGDRSNFEGDRPNSQRYRGKNACDGAA